MTYNYQTARKRDYASSAETYEGALRDASELNDEPAIRAVTKALADVNLLKDAKFEIVETRKQKSKPGSSHSFKKPANNPQPVAAT
jgi:hypothetical protein